MPCIFLFSLKDNLILIAMIYIVVWIICVLVILFNIFVNKWKKYIFPLFISL